MKLVTPNVSTTLRDLLTMGIATVGGFIALWLNVPAGLLVGGTIAVALAALFRLEIGLSKPVVNVALVIVGMAIGASVAPDTLALLPQWPVSLVALIFMLALITAVTGFVLHIFFGMDRTTAYLCAVPGHMTMIVGLAATGLGDARRIAIVMSVRVLFLTIVLPLGAMFGGDLPAKSVVETPVLDPLGLAVLTIACVIGGLVFVYFKVSAGLILGTMVVGIVGKLAGFYDGSLPAPLTGFAFVAMGALIGTRMSGISWQELRHSAIAGLVVTLIAVGIVSGTAWLITLVVDMPLGQMWLGLAPGGLEAMAALGLAFGYDSAFIAAHHTWRLLLIGVAISILVPVLGRKGERARKL